MKSTLKGGSELYNPARGSCLTLVRGRLGLGPCDDPAASGWQFDDA